MVVGVGVNVRTRILDLPEELRGAATSLAAEGVEVEIEALARGILLCGLGSGRGCRWGRLWEGSAGARDWLRGREVELEVDGEGLLGKVAGIGAAGGLLVERGGTIREFERGTVRGVR